MAHVTLTAILAFLATIALFGAAAWRGLHRVRGVHDFFHLSGGQQNFVKLLVATLTVGTGLSYLLTAGAQKGLLMLAVPVAVGIGFYLLAAFNKLVVHPRLTNSGNLLLGIEREIGSDRGRSSSFGYIVALPLIAIFVLVFAYEIFVSSQVLSAFVAPGGGTGWQIGISLVLFLASLAYCLAGGIQAAARIEYLQLSGILVFLSALIAASFMGAGGEPQPVNWGLALKADFHTLAAVFLAVISAISTQFYNLLNMHAVSNLTERSERSVLLRRVGLSVAGVFAVIVVLGALVPLDWSGGLSSALAGLFAPFEAFPAISHILLVVLVVGIASLVMSTIDNLMVTLTMFVKENLLSRLVFTSKARSDSLAAARTTLLVLFVFGFAILAFFNYTRPNVFYLLLSIASGVDVFTPLIVLAGLLSRYQGGLSALTDRALLGYALLFISALSINLGASVSAPELVPYIGITHFVLSSLYTLVVAARSKPWRSVALPVPSSP